MKYAEFVEFKRLLEINNVTIQEWIENPEMKLLTEEELDTKTGYILTRKGRARGKLNKRARKLQEQINEQLAEKYLDEIFNTKRDFYKRMADLLQEKQPKEVISELRDELKNIKELQQKQISIIEDQAKKFIDNTTKEVENSLDKSKLKDASKTDLKIYWGLLSTQILMNLLQSFVKKDNKLIRDVIDDPKIKKIATQINKKYINPGVEKATKAYAEQAEEKKAQVDTSDDKKEKESEEESKEEKTKED